MVSQTDSYRAALKLAQRLLAAHPHLSERPHILYLSPIWHKVTVIVANLLALTYNFTMIIYIREIQRGLMSISTKKGDLRTCLAAANEIQRFSDMPPTIETLTTVLTVAHFYLFSLSLAYTTFSVLFKITLI